MVSAGSKCYLVGWLKKDKSFKCGVRAIFSSSLRDSGSQADCVAYALSGKKRYKGLKPIVFVSWMYGLKPVPFRERETYFRG
jgi:hypothetical protein